MSHRELPLSNLEWYHQWLLKIQLWFYDHKIITNSLYFTGADELARASSLVGR